MNAHRDEPATKKNLDQVKQELTDKIDANGKKIDQVEQRLTGRLDRLTVYAIENRELVEKMLTEEKFKVYFNEIMNSIDGLAKVVSRGEPERAATNARIDRVERDLSAVVDRQA
jgi:uncharacterized protein YPO0396